MRARCKIGFYAKFLFNYPVLALACLFASITQTATMEESMQKVKINIFFRHTRLHRHASDASSTEAGSSAASVHIWRPYSCKFSTPLLSLKRFSCSFNVYFSVFYFDEFRKSFIYNFILYQRCLIFTHNEWHWVRVSAYSYHVIVKHERLSINLASMNGINYGEGVEGAQEHL